MCPNASQDKRVVGVEEESPCSDTIGVISCTTFNILAPIYKRMSHESRESEFREYWLTRNETILDRLVNLRSSLICLQEFWVGNEELVVMYERRLGDAGYATYKLARTNNRGDGLLTAVSRQHFNVLRYKQILFHDFGDRIAQLLHIDLAINFSQNDLNVKKEALLVNTHLLFPHNPGCCFHRLQQVYKILQYIESYCEEYQLLSIPIILCGDWNGSNKGNVYKFLQSQGFTSSYDTAHQYTRKWVSHRNHRGNICGVDFIWLLNPNSPRKPLKESFIEAVLGNIKNHLSEEPLDSTDQLHHLKTNIMSNYITYNQFCESLEQLGLTSSFNDGLSAEEIKDMWDYVDTNRDGVIDLTLFDIVLNSPAFQYNNDNREDRPMKTEALLDKSKISNTIGFDVKSAVLFPPEVEQGNWPEHYSLSDHAHLTVDFSPVMIHCS